MVPILKISIGQNLPKTKLKKRINYGLTEYMHLYKILLNVYLVILKNKKSISFLHIRQSIHFFFFCSFVASIHCSCHYSKSLWIQEPGDEGRKHITCTLHKSKNEWEPYRGSNGNLSKPRRVLLRDFGLVEMGLTMSISSRPNAGILKSKVKRIYQVYQECSKSILS